MRALTSVNGVAELPDMTIRGSRPFSAPIRAAASSKVIVCTESVSQRSMSTKQGHWSLSTPPLIRDDRVVKEIRWFEDIRLRDTDSVGGKGANLGELTAGGLPVPPRIRDHG